MLRRLLLLLAGLALARVAGAGVAFDPSMGPAGPAPTRVVPGFSTDYLIPYDEGVDPADRHGVLLGSNLFQSLSILDLDADERATLQALDPSGTPLAGIDRVFARVTNGAPSTIQGVLRSEVSGADVYLLNPAGIYFLGQGGIRRQLDVPRSFAASTADFLRFDDDTVFQVDDLVGFSLSSAPLASFGFLPGPAGEIHFDQTLPFEVPKGQTLTLVGGNIVIGGDSTVQAQGGTLQIGAVGGAGVEVPADLSQWSVHDAPEGSLGDISVLHFSEAQVVAPATPQDPQGRIVFRGGRLVVDDSAVIAGGNDGPDALAIDAELADEIVVSTDSRFQVTGTRAVGLGGARLTARRVEVADPGTFVGPRPVFSTAGTFSVDADELLVRDLAVLGTQARAAVGAELDVHAGSIEVRGDGRIESLTRGGSLPGGKLLIEGDRVELAEGVDGIGSVRSVSEDGGRGGDIELRAGELLLHPRARVEALAGPAAPGGDLLVTADSIALEGGAQIRTGTSGDQDAGDVRVTANQRIEIRGDDPLEPAGIFARSGESALAAGSGRGGDLSVSAPVIEMSGQAALSTRSFGEGNPGTLTVDAPERLTLQGTEAGVPEISARVQDGDSGGSIGITAGQVEVLGGAAISSATLGRAPGGTISLEADDLLVSGANEAEIPSAIDSDSVSLLPDAGDAGAIAITAHGDVRVTATGEIAARTRGPGNAGSVSIAADGDVTVDDGGVVTATALFSSGEAGNVSIEGRNVSIDGGAVTTEASNGSADPPGGNIDLVAGRDVRLTGGALVSARSTGSQDAGRVHIEAGRTLFAKQSLITTEAGDAAGGQVELTAGHKVELVDSTVSTSVLGGITDENGGDITIDPRYVVVNRSQVLAQAILGNGGNIRIVAGSYLESTDSLVDASSEKGIDGVVDIEAPVSELTGELTQLPAHFLDATALLREHCAARVAGQGSFVVAGTEGRAADPDHPLPAPMPLPGPAPLDNGHANAGAAPADPPRLDLAAVDCRALARAFARRGVHP